MAWLTKDKYGCEQIFNNCPRLHGDYWEDPHFTGEYIKDSFTGFIKCVADGVDLPSGTIKLIFGKDISMEECPIELKEK